MLRLLAESSFFLSALAVGMTVLSGSADAADDKSAAGDTRVFEMRTYICHPGRLDALNKRFRDHTCKLFEKHGMTLVGFWTPTDENKEPVKDTLVYILAFPSREARDASFKAFGADPEWKAAQQASEADGKIVQKVISTFMNPTDYSYIK